MSVEHCLQRQNYGVACILKGAVEFGNKSRRMLSLGICTCDSYRTIQEKIRPKSPDDNLCFSTQHTQLKNINFTIYSNLHNLQGNQLKLSSAKIRYLRVATLLVLVKIAFNLGSSI